MTNDILATAGEKINSILGLFSLQAADFSLAHSNDIFLTCNFTTRHTLTYKKTISLALLSEFSSL